MIASVLRTLAREHTSSGAVRLEHARDHVALRLEEREDRVAKGPARGIARGVVATRAIAARKRRGAVRRAIAASETAETAETAETRSERKRTTDGDARRTATRDARR